MTSRTKRAKRRAEEKMNDCWVESLSLIIIEAML
jgi:hypothetical protein